MADPRNGFKATIKICNKNINVKIVFTLSNIIVFTAKCGGTLRGFSGTIKSPYYGNIPMFPKNIECIWHIIAPHDHTLSFTFNTLSIPQDYNCPNNYVKIYNVNAFDNVNSNPISSLVDSKVSRLIGTYCHNIITENITSSSNEVMVQFSTQTSKSGYSGFSLTFNASQDCMIYIE